MGKAAVKNRSCVCISVKDKNSFSTPNEMILKNLFTIHISFVCFRFVFSLRVYFIFMTRVGRFFSVCAEEKEAISLLLMASVENLYNLGQMIDGVDKSLGGALLLFECTFFALLCPSFAKFLALKEVKCISNVDSAPVVKLIRFNEARTSC